MTNRVFAPKGKPAPSSKRVGDAVSSAKRPKRGTKFRYTLSEPARVKIAIERKKPGKKGRKPRFAKVTTISQQKKSGRQSTAFSGRVRGKRLKPGSYRARITATDTAGQTSQPRQLSFRIVGG